MSNIQRYICQIVSGKSDDLRRIGLEPCRPFPGAVCKTEDVEKLEALNAELLEAAKALVERWDTPLWKLTEHTGVFIDRLRAAIAKADDPK